MLFAVSRLRAAREVKVRLLLAGFVFAMGVADVHHAVLGMLFAENRFLVSRDIVARNLPAGLMCAKLQLTQGRGLFRRLRRLQRGTREQREQIRLRCEQLPLRRTNSNLDCICFRSRTRQSSPTPYRTPNNKQHKMNARLILAVI